MSKLVWFQRADRSSDKVPRLEEKQIKEVNTVLYHSGTQKNQDLSSMNCC